MENVLGADMASFSLPALRHIVCRIEEMTSAPHEYYDAATNYRLEALKRRALARVATAAREVATAAEAGDAPAELRALAALVRAGDTTWEQCVAGKADHLPAVHAWLSAMRPPPAREPDVARPARPRPTARRRQDDYGDDDEEAMVQSIFLDRGGRRGDGR
jgi:hypothetical protein